MTVEVPTALRELITRFVETYSSVPDIELNLENTKLRFMPLDSYEAKREAAHYFLLSASLSDFGLTGNPRNTSLLLTHLLSALENKLYAIKNPSEFAQEITKFEYNYQKLEHLGRSKAQIPHILCSVNKFVEEKANGDLIDYAAKLSRKGRKPKDFVQQLSYKVKGMNKQHTSKSWLYLRWMVRRSPDLGLFQFDPRDLMVPLTTPKLRVYVALGLSNNENLPLLLNRKNRPESWWKNTAEFDTDAEWLTSFARSLFPEDPAKIDFPFFMLGTWLEYSDLTLSSLEKSLRFFIQKYRDLVQPLIQYLSVVSHYNRVGEVIAEPGAFSGFERDVFDFLNDKQVIFYYEFMEFRLSKDNPLLTYKPDFLLPQFTDRGRKVLFEPHGVKANIINVLVKLSIFRRQYGEFFCLVLIVPDDLIQVIDRMDPDHNSCDYLWRQSTYKIQFENFHKT
jgi:hypothetical protein